MNVEPIINARFKKFKEQFEITNLIDGLAFERFVNHTILSSHQPDAFSADNELLDKVCVGGPNDLGIDGLAVKLNGLLIRDVSDVKDILEKFKRANVEFIFIQSKYKSNFDMGEFNNFIAGVRDFLSENPKHPKNEKVSEFLEIKDFLLSEDVVVMWDENPSVRLYYVAMGKWKDSPHHLALAAQLKEDISNLNTYGNINVHFVDSDSLKTICDNNENTFTRTINSIDTMDLTPVEDVDNSCIILCYANEFVKLLKTEEGVIRKSLFDDNVRDFQGSTNVNAEIENTIKKDPSTFILLNNGVTIVCDEYISSNRKITLKNPQIVNGCQTSHVLYFASNNGADLSKVPLNIKVISTQNNEITNHVLRGTNRQNIVYDEAFETTKQFHKDLKEFFNALSPEYERLYYERRSKQYQQNPTIKQTQKINLRILCQSFVGMFLNKPHLAHRHESKLLREFSNVIFQEYQSKLPYFTSALSFYTLEKLFRDYKLPKRDLLSFRSHILMIFRELVAGSCPSINHEKKVDEHCRLILNVLKNSSESEANFRKATDVFMMSKNIWTTEMGKSQYGIKDIEEFTKLLTTQVSSQTTVSSDLCEDESSQYKGKVIKIFNDRYGKLCGFIARKPSDIFFHSTANKGLNFNELLGKYVSYTVTVNPKNNNLLAVEVEVET
jgi:hypothetical protein